MTRRLAAILAADIAGYSRLMGEDQAGTLAALRQIRSEAFGPTVAVHQGKIVKSMGDGWLVEFGSAVDAVNCALRLQDQLADDPIIRLRIGIHIGDIVHQDEDIFGDGVNVAARLEANAEPGSVAISDSVYFSLDGTLKPSFDSLGTQALKNIDRPVGVWSRSPRGASTPAAVGTAADDFPTIAIVPVATSDERPEVQELADALTADLRTYLDSSSWMKAAITEASVAGAYSFRATLRARGERLRLEAHLANGEGAEIWAGKFDGNLAESFDWQDEIAEEITAQCVPPVFDTESARLARKPERELRANHYLLLGFQTLYSLNRAALAQAARYFAIAIDADPDSPMAYSQALRCLIHARQWGYRDVVEEHAKAFAYWREKARALPSAGALHDIILTFTDYILKPEPIVLQAAVERALRKAPFDAEVLTYCALTHLYAGEPRKVLECTEKAERYGKLAPFRIVIAFAKATAFIQLGQDTAALDELDRYYGSVNDAPTIHRVRAAALGNLGRQKEAAVAIREVLRLVPDDSVANLRDRNGFIDRPGNRRFLDGLRFAGMPE